MPRSIPSVLVLVGSLATLIGTSRAQTHSYMRAHFIDVGQGDATLLEFPCGAVLVDAGGKDSQTDAALYDYLDRFFDRRDDLDRTIDVVFVTHTHIDHNRALRRLIENDELGFTVRRYVHNGLLNGSGRFAAQWMDEHAEEFSISSRDVEVSEVRALSSRRGLSGQSIDPIDCGAINPRIRVLSGQMDVDAGWTHGEQNDGNNHSLVIRVDFGRASFLLTGDLEFAGIDTLLDYYSGTRMLDVDVYQVGHHGAANGTTGQLVKAMSPRVSVISMSSATDRRAHTAWSYGHPRKSTVDHLVEGTTRRRRPKNVRIATGMRRFGRMRMTRAVFATGWDGTVVVFARSDGRMLVRTSAR